MLKRITLGSNSAGGERRESFVQDLVHDHPDVIPMAEIEPAFYPLVSICRELPTSAGYLDNLWITPAGGIVLGECKLVRNPQARREVIAQALDYARAINAWGYEDLEANVRKALKDPAASIWSLVAPHRDLDEAGFVDAVQRRLSLGRFLVLIIGDGIQEGVEALTSFLQLHAGLHTGLALLDLAIWEGVGDGLVVVPRVPMRTVIIERGVVTADPLLGVKVGPPPEVRASMVRSASMSARAVTASEPEFYDELEQRRSGLATPVRALMSDLRELGVEPEFRRSLLLRVPVASSDQLSLGLLDNRGKFYCWNAWSSANRLGHAAAADFYQNSVAEMTRGQVKHYDTTPPEVFGSDGKGLDITELMKQKTLWFAAITSFVTIVAKTYG